MHPNFQATEFVIEKFMTHFVNEESITLSKEIEKIIIARKHKPFQPATEAHKNFLKIHADRTRNLMNSYPFLSLQEELDFFGQGHA